MNAIYLISDENLSDIAGLQAQRFAQQWDCDVHVFLERQDTSRTIRKVATHPRVTYHYEALSPLLPQGLPSTKKWPHVVYLRLFAPLLLSQYSRILYVDADVLSMKSDPSIWNIELPEGIGAVSDIGKLNRPAKDAPGMTREEWLNSIGVTSGKYLNSGVLLMDPSKIAKIDFGAELLRYFEAYPKAARFDQDFLASFFDGAWTELSPRLNYQAHALELGYTEAVDPLIIHFSTPSKPWHGWPNDRWRSKTSPRYTQIYYDLLAQAGMDPKSFERPHPVNHMRALKFSILRKLYTLNIPTRRARKAIAEWQSEAAFFGSFYNEALANNRFADDHRKALPSVMTEVCFDGRFAKASVSGN